MLTRAKRFSITILVIAEMAGMILWFATAAILPDMTQEVAISEVRQPELWPCFLFGVPAIVHDGCAKPRNFRPWTLYQPIAHLAHLPRISIVVFDARNPFVSDQPSRR